MNTIFVGFITYNNSKETLQIVNQMISQSFLDWKLYIFDFNSDTAHVNLIKYNLNKINDSRIFFIDDDMIKLNISRILNKALSIFLNSDCNYFTLISVNNKYDINYFLSIFSKYNSFTFYYKKIRNYENSFYDLIYNYKNYGSFIWSKRNILDIGYYNDNLLFLEDYEYLLRTFLINDDKKFDIEDTIYNLDLMPFKNKKIFQDKVKILELLYTRLDKYKNVFIFYSNKDYYKIFPYKPHQIIKFLSNTYLKIFFCLEDTIEFMENIIIISYRYKELILNVLIHHFNKKQLYYNDYTLVEEINEIKEKYKIEVIYDINYVSSSMNLENLVKSSDIIIYSHPDILNILNTIDSKQNYIYIPNGCDYEHFKKSKNKIYPKPSILNKTNKPILGYFGACNDNIDYVYLQKIANSNKYHILMIGGIQGNKYLNMRLEHKNISWIPYVNYEDLPRYLSWFDMCLLPLKEKLYMNPCKLWEYMSSDKEIISNLDINFIVDNLSRNKETIKIEEEVKKLELYLDHKIEKNDFFFKNDILPKKKKILIISRNNNNFIRYSNTIKKAFDKEYYIREIIEEYDYSSMIKYYDTIILNGININIENEKLEKIIRICDGKIIQCNNDFPFEPQIDFIRKTDYIESYLCVAIGNYNTSSNYNLLIKEFSKIEKKYKLEIFGDVENIVYYNELETYKKINNLNNVYLNKDYNNYLERLYTAEYYFIFSEEKSLNYGLLEAIYLNKKIIYLKNLYLKEFEWYPNKIKHTINSSLFDWLSLTNVNYHVNYGNTKYLKNILEPINKKKIGKVTVTNINDVLEEIENGLNKEQKNGYSFLIRVKNEENTIEKCILDIVEIADEIIVVDNNSTDNTLYILKRLEKIYDNIFIYEYKINIPRYGIEHIENYKRLDIEKNNTLANYYNWTLSKSTYDKKIKWDGDFYAIKNNLIELLEMYKGEIECTSIWFSGLTLFKHNKNYYIKKESYYNEFRLFVNGDDFIWSDNIYNEKNYCETSYHFSKNSRYIKYYLKPVFYEIKDTSKDEFSSRSLIDIDDSRDTLDKHILQKLLKTNDSEYLFLSKEPFSDCFDFTLKNDDEFYNNVIVTDLNKLKFRKIQNILLIIDSLGWAFDNISKNVKKYTKDANIYICTYPELYDKLNENYTMSLYRKMYDYCNVDLKKIDHVIFFWYGGICVDILKILKSKYSFKSIHLCVYDYSKWIYNINKKEEELLYDNICDFFKIIDGYFYSCPLIKKLIESQEFYTNKIGFPCFDGVDKELFYYQGYEKDIYTKNKLVIGWLGNSNPSSHGINKGFEIIKNVIGSLNDKFIFEPQDLYTTGKIEHIDIPKYLSKIDIIVCFSMAEGTPNQILEASSSGKCWISTDVGIVKELYNTIPNNPTGIIISRKENELSNALLYLYNNRNLIVEYGKNGRLAIEKCWDWSKKSRQFLEVLKSPDSF